MGFTRPDLSRAQHAPVFAFVRASIAPVLPRPMNCPMGVQPDTLPCSRRPTSGMGQCGQPWLLTGWIQPPVNLGRQLVELFSWPARS